MSIEKQVEALGWSLEEFTLPNVGGIEEYRAVQGGFSTPWRETQDDVLKDLKEMARIEKALDKAEAKLAD